MVKLEDYTTTELKKMISSFNKIVKFSGYSKLKKAELITMIRTHPKVKVEEGANAVKLSIKTDEDFEKQKKVKKEKVKKEVKKEVEKLDDVKVVVKPVEKKEEPDLLTLMDKFNKKYNAVEIKKQNLNKSNLKDFTEPYFKELEKIEKELENMDDSIEFFKTNKKISSGFVDIRKNFIRRVKAQMKVKKEEPEKKKKKIKFNVKAKKEEPKKE